MDYQDIILYYGINPSRKILFLIPLTFSINEMRDLFKMAKFPKQRGKQNKQKVTSFYFGKYKDFL